MIRVVAKFNLKPEETKKAMPLFEELISLTRKENGCESYVLAQSPEDENVCVILEAWENEEVLSVHSNSEHFKRIVPQLGEMCVEAPSVDSFKQII